MTEQRGPRRSRERCCVAIGRLFVAGALAVLLVPVPLWAQTLAEIRVHGNHTTPDSDVVAMAGVAVGSPVGPATAAEVAERLRATGRFEEVDVRLRYRALSETGDVSLVIVVREHPAADIGPRAPVLAPVVRTLGRGMFLPILDYADGYGVTYGLRTTFPNTLGRDSRLSVPLSWGATKQAAVEIGKTVAAQSATRLEGGVTISRRENPFYRLQDDRREAWLAFSGAVAGGLRASLHSRLARVTFGPATDRVFAWGARLTIDTRRDPVFPRNAVYGSAGWERLDPRGPATVNKYRVEGRAYIGLPGQAVVSVRALHGRADGPLPAHERLLLGGGACAGACVPGGAAPDAPDTFTLRGYRAGSFAGDKVVAGSIELRVPLDSPLSMGKAGVSFFVDTGAACDYGARLRQARFRHGVGGGLFLLVSVFQVSAELGVRAGGGTRFHVLSGFQF